jgi:hypothetical protein
MKHWQALILFLVGAAASICLLLLYAYAPDLRGNDSNQADAVSHSAIGFAGLKQLMEASGIAVEIDRGAVLGEARNPSLTILTPPAFAGAQALHDYQEQGPVLIVLPKWTTMPMPFKSSWVVKTGAFHPDTFKYLLAPIAKLQIAQASGDRRAIRVEAASPLAGVPLQLNGDIQQLQSATGGKGDRLMLLRGGVVSGEPDPAAMAVLLRIRGGDKPIYVLTEPDLMNNHGLADETTAEVALGIIRSLRRGASPVRMDVTLNGMTRAPSLLKVLFEPPFRGATLCVFLAAILMALHALARFGAPLGEDRIQVRGKTALVDNTAALVRLMGREAAMATRYVQASREMVLARLGRRGGREQDDVLAAMESRSGSDVHYDTLASQATQARNSDDLMRIAAEAYAWRGRITGEH